MFYQRRLHDAVVSVEKAMELWEALDGQFAPTVVRQEELEGAVGVPEPGHLLQLLILPCRHHLDLLSLVKLRELAIIGIAI